MCGGRDRLLYLICLKNDGRTVRRNFILSERESLAEEKGNAQTIVIEPKLSKVEKSASEQEEGEARANASSLQQGFPAPVGHAR